jgi:S-formylglutathione hydrolase FrmB
MNPTSPLVEVLIFGAAIALLILLVKIPVVLPRIAVGAFALTLAMSGGVVAVNDYFGYYRSWTDAHVPHDLSVQFRVATDPAQWGLFGLSAGGYCAANLALRHRSQWRAAVSLAGYYLPSDGPARVVINRNPQLAYGNNPIETAADLPTGTSPLPTFWLGTGTGNADDMTEARLFENAMEHLERIHVTVLRGGTHTFYSLRQTESAALEWMWSQLSPPDLRVGSPSPVR